ncbi:hypothetical protein HHK36_000340 [Tetracentron sinense]|uniref:Uncharacterized protein n=1 Tax=Tetracentron sinense TaxID=13715 RepID=A0A834ZS06_TETSI|nr:hypothetical protein HHK36_000340 [Tetracentron sinense]
MKLVWSPETASKAYIDTVKLCELFEESGVAELVSAMAGGWNTKLIVEAWSRGGVTATSVGLAVASRHSGGRHVCIVPDEQSKSEYVEAMRKVGISPEIIVGGAEETMGRLSGVDFLVVDCQRRDFVRILRLAKLSNKGAVLICKNANPRTDLGFRWRGVLGNGSSIVKSVFLPVGKGLEIAHVAAAGSVGNLNSGKGTSRWIRHIDQQSGEEHVFRK